MLDSQQHTFKDAFYRHLTRNYDNFRFFFYLSYFLNIEIPDIYVEIADIDLKYEIYGLV